MKYINLGKSGLKVSEMTYGTALTIGTEKKDIEYAYNLVSTAWDLGIRSFDTSNNYGEAERILGEVLKTYPRQEFVLATKGSWPIGESPYHKGLSRKHILWAVENSLEKLQTDYVDLYYAHRYDQDVPMEEIVRTFNYLIQTGKIRYWATSEWPLEALQECVKTCEKLNLEKPVAEQFIYSYALRKVEATGVKDFCEQSGIGMLGFSPLCQGYLTGKYKDGIPNESRISKSKLLNYNKTVNFYKQNKDTIDFFLNACAEYNISSIAVALQWCIRNKIYPVIGASKAEQLISNVNALDTIIPDDLWNKLEQREPLI